jgi:hypothetical protein
MTKLANLETSLPPKSKSETFEFGKGNGMAQR